MKVTTRYLSVKSYSVKTMYVKHDMKTRTKTQQSKDKSIDTSVANKTRSRYT